MLIEGFYIKNRNPKLDEIFTGVYIINNIFIWIKSKFNNEKEVLLITIKLPYEWKKKRTLNWTAPFKVDRIKKDLLKSTLKRVFLCLEKIEIIQLK